jgi:hypothetical protein
VEKKVNNMAKARPIVIKSGSKFKGPGWNGQKVEPFKQPVPSKTFDPKKGGSIEVIPT